MIVGSAVETMVPLIIATKSTRSSPVRASMVCRWVMFSG